MKRCRWVNRWVAEAARAHLIVGLVAVVIHVMIVGFLGQLRPQGACIVFRDFDLLCQYWRSLTDNTDMYVLRLRFVVKVTSWLVVYGAAIFAVRGFAWLMELAPFVFSRSW